jgi:hypothetical protein
MGHKGQTMTEYGLAFCIIAPMSLVALMSLSSNVYSIMFGLIPKHSLSAAIYEPSVQDLPTSISVKQTTPAQDNKLTTINNLLPLEQLLGGSLPVSPRDTKNSLQVSGANGTTKQLANILLTEAQKLLEAGDITPNQAQSLIGLANQGFTLAEGQKLLEDTLHNNEKEITYNGKTYPIRQFATLFSINPPPNIQWDLTPQYGAPLMKPFMEQYQAVLESGVLNTPGIEKTVSSLSYQIVAIGDALSWSLEELSTESQDNIPLDTLNSRLAETFQLDLSATMIGFPDASARTRQNSTEICSTGSGSSNGTVCTP